MTAGSATAAAAVTAATAVTSTATAACAAPLASSTGSTFVASTNQSTNPGISWHGFCNFCPCRCQLSKMIAGHRTYVCQTLVKRR